MINLEPSNIIIRRNDSSSLSALSKHYAIMTSKKFHKFTIFNGAILKREQVLAAIVKQVSPNYLLPVKYENDGFGNSQFLSANCWNAVRALVSNDLMVTIPELSLQLEIEIHLDYKFSKDFKVPPMEAIQLALRRRVFTGDKSNFSLDVSNLEMDEVFLGPTDVYFPLWVPQFQRVIVQTMQSVLFLKCINLSHNKISSLFELSKLHCPKLEELNLSHNEITWSDLIPILPQKVKFLWLEGNPLCATPLSEYINAIKTLYPLLVKLDGVTIYPDNEITYTMKNSFVNSTPHNLVDKFLHHYFTWFSRRDGRSLMVHMYHKNASISISCNMRPNTDNSDHIFQYLSRNILRISNYGKTVDSFQTGTVHISLILKLLPYLQIDPKTATVDVPYYVDNKVMQICMAGIFRDDERRMYWIGFTFLLQASPDSSLKEWKIVNQMMSITSATPEQTKGAFGNDLKSLEVKQFEPNREDSLSQFEELTSMKTSYCQQFLESTCWNMESALQSFVDQYKGDLVPEEAFI